jgi:hypothetical protein
VLQGDEEVGEVEIRLLASQVAGIFLSRPQKTNATLENLVFRATRGLVPWLDPDNASQLLQRLMTACQTDNSQR